KSRYSDYDHMAKYPVYSFRDYVSKLGVTAQNKEIASVDLKLTSEEIAEGKKILDNLIANNKRTICLFTYATGAKCYDSAWWIPFYERLKKEYPHYNIIEVLPVENVSQIHFAAPSFYSKDIRQIGAFIANTDVFIGADSGMMHLASASKTPTVGLFKVTHATKYAPYNNRSVAINTNTSTIDDLIKVLNNILL